MSMNGTRYPKWIAKAEEEDSIKLRAKGSKNDDNSDCLRNKLGKGLETFDIIVDMDQHDQCGSGQQEPVAHHFICWHLSIKGVEGQGCDNKGQKYSYPSQARHRDIVYSS